MNLFSSPLPNYLIVPLLYEEAFGSPLFMSQAFGSPLFVSQAIGSPKSPNESPPESPKESSPASSRGSFFMSQAQAAISSLSLRSRASFPSRGSSSPYSSFELIINNALNKYKKRTRNDILTHPLTAQLRSCDSPGDILAILQRQVQGLDQSRNSDERWSRSLEPTVNVLYSMYSFSVTLGEDGLVCLRT